MRASMAGCMITLSTSILTMSSEMEWVGVATTINIPSSIRKQLMTIWSHLILSVQRLAMLLIISHMYVLAMQGLRVWIGHNGLVTRQATLQNIVDFQVSSVACSQLVWVAFLSLEVILVDLCGPSLLIWIFGSDGLNLGPSLGLCALKLMALL